MTVRLSHHDGRQPLRCVVTASGKLPARAKLATDGAAETIVFHPEGTTLPDAWRPFSVPLPRRTEGVDLAAALRWLVGRGANRVLAEGGAVLSSQLLVAGLVNRLSIVFAPKLFGSGAIDGIGALGVSNPTEALMIDDLQVSALGPDTLVSGRPARPGRAG